MSKSFPAHAQTLSLKRSARFTLVELILVVAVMALLATLSLSALDTAADQDKSTACLNNLKKLGETAATYSTDNDGWMFGPFAGTIYTKQEYNANASYAIALYKAGYINGTMAKDNSTGWKIHWVADFMTCPAVPDLTRNAASQGSTRQDGLVNAMQVYGLPAVTFNQNRKRIYPDKAFKLSDPSYANPGNFIFGADSVHTKMLMPIYSWSIDDVSKHLAGVHNGLCNAVYLDGHAASNGQEFYRQRLFGAKNFTVVNY